jgi:hypothetical protein
MAIAANVVAGNTFANACKFFAFITFQVVIGSNADTYKFFDIEDLLL